MFSKRKTKIKKIKKIKITKSEFKYLCSFCIFKGIQLFLYINIFIWCCWSIERDVNVKDIANIKTLIQMILLQLILFFGWKEDVLESGEFIYHYYFIKE